MCNFNKQSEDNKALIHLFMTKAAESIGGANFLLALIEAMRAHKPHPLTYKGCKIESPNATIEWNKIIFKDKFDLLNEIILSHKSSQNPDFNILENDNNKKKKNILNMVKTLAPLEFVVTPKNEADGGGFNFKVFENSDVEYVKINPIFVSMFFCSAEFSKKALKFEI
ncbi:MAG: hypothetical protein PHH41_09175 [Sulfurimonas sp.]|nr:hypothetical protein [Sulfurimonas sp.]MDD3060157.1 hypothetical protein [Sulfurimonas sp.]MDD5203299.1 hypothetical protein [Sulfurimonas sp.]